MKKDPTSKYWTSPLNNKIIFIQSKGQEIDFNPAQRLNPFLHLP